MSDTEKNTTQRNPRNIRAVKKKKAPSRGRPVKKAQVKSDSSDNKGLGDVLVRNEYYRDGYRMALRVAVIQSFVILFLIGAMYYVVHVHQPEDKYFATTVDGRVIPMVSLSEPNLSRPALLSWVVQAATETMTFGFSDYRRRLQESSRHFTKSGWAAFAGELSNDKFIEQIEASSQMLTAAPAAAPIIEKEAITEGRYQWIVKLPLVLSYESHSGGLRTDKWMVTLVVVRVPRLESPNGVGIAQWIAAPI